jgi:hypothetical protein
MSKCAPSVRLPSWKTTLNVLWSTRVNHHQQQHVNAFPCSPFPPTFFFVAIHLITFAVCPLLCGSVLSACKRPSAVDCLLPCTAPSWRAVLFLFSPRCVAVACLLVLSSVCHFISLFLSSRYFCIGILVVFVVFSRPSNHPEI